MASASQQDDESRFGFSGTPMAASRAAESLVVLTQDATLLATLRAVAPGHEISAVGAEADLAVQLLSDRGGVVVIDAAAVANPVASLTERLKSQFPDLVLVVAGGAEDQATLTAQIGDGTVYRFLHKPLSEQRVKLFIGAAWRRRGEEHAGITGVARTHETPIIRPARPFKALWIGAAVVIAIGALWVGRHQPKRTAPTQVTVSPLEAVDRPAPLIAPAEEPPPEDIDKPPFPAPATPTAAAAPKPAPAPPPLDTETQDKQRQLLERLIGEARKAFAASDADEGERWMQAASQAGASEEDMDSLRREAQRVRLALRAQAITRLSQQFNARIAQNLLVEPANDSAAFYLAQLKQTEADHPSTRLAQQTLTMRLVDEARRFVPRQDLPAARRWLAEARDAGASAESVAAVEREILASQDAAGKADEVVADTALNKRHHVDPEYPAEARKRGVNGWVEVALTVQPDGSVGEVSIVRADPPGLFDKAAVEAVRKWRYEPVGRDGQAVAQRTQVRILFRLE